MIDFPVVDAHHHFWDPVANPIPWLREEPMIAFRYGDYSAIRRPYLPDDYLRDSAGIAIAKSVYVETEWDPTDPLGETRWVTSVAETSGYPHAVVAQAWLDRADVEEVLAGQAAFPLVRSIRHKPRAAPRPDGVREGTPGSMSDPAWRRGFAHLAPNGLSFDLQVVWWHLEEAARLAADFPDTTIILNHTGLPSDRTEAGLRGWHQAMARLAREPNVAVKISGIGQPGVPWTADGNRRVVLETIELFGIERCMLASNFPVDGLCADFRTIYDGFDRITAELSRDERRRLFHDNAVAYYRL